MGFASCNATYFCRICELTLEECKTATEDDLSRYRTKENYAIALDQIETATKVDYKVTKGIVRYCVLNDMQYFHIFDNFNVDIMHDLAEGVIPFLLKNLFSYCIKTSLLTEEELRNYALFYNYGVLNSRNIPSAICFERRNLGQNASQQKCLMLHVPYILHKFKDDARLVKVWPCVTSLLGILRIIYDANITESDLVQLETFVSEHLKSIIQHFPDTNFLRKHHYMLHYANIIRAVGPVIHMSTMRFEMQHKSFTNFGRRSQNYVNVTKSLAVNFQKSKLAQTPYQNVINNGKWRDIPDSCLEYHTDILIESFGKLEHIYVTKWLRINNNFYKKQLILKDNNKAFCEIDEVLASEGNFYFLCHQLEIRNFDKFLCSVEIQERSPTKYLILEEKKLLVKKSFTKNILNNKFYIIADCLNVPAE